ncbi:DUF47 family protein [Fusibacter sp. 3D3]|uniref:DUF47 family protein n=1 Tax=Fusibacter sp. 3D3 TaxID=1048380 RepID=UPI000852C463|nr:DUF47 family protein [Fusibacter sp. 3D3]GAU76554.1 phosphate transport regulator [Fusibacter sp. 3D3]
MTSIFKKSIELNMKIEKFLDIISQSLLLLEKAIHAYLSDDCETFENTFDRICTLETEADHLEFEIKTALYVFMLLPDTRADVLSLVKSLDNIIDATEEIAKEFHIQKPIFPSSLNENILALIANTLKSADFLLLAARAFLSELHMAASHISKVKFYEHETDLLEEKINYALFNDQIVSTLAEKRQLKEFTSMIAGISDEAELIGDKLSIFIIKREI